jgi:hypothetical protein
MVKTPVAKSSSAPRPVKRIAAKEAKKITTCLKDLGDSGAKFSAFAKRLELLEQRNEHFLEFLRDGEDSKGLDYEATKADVKDITMPMSLLSKFLPDDWRHLYDVSIDIWAPKRADLADSVLRYNPFSANSEGKVVPDWAECRQGPGDERLYHKFTRNEVLYCMKTALKTGKYWAGKSVINARDTFDVDIECNDFIGPIAK